MSIDEIFIKYSPQLFLLYVILREILPMLRASFLQILPASIQYKQSREERQEDLKEREVIALEQIGKTLIIVETRLGRVERDQGVLATSLTNANTALSIILDRMDNPLEKNK